MNVEYTVQTWREGKQYVVAEASPLDVVSAGPTPEQARQALRKWSIFSETAEENGTLEEVLTECGYEFDGATWQSPASISIEEQRRGIL